MGFWLQEYQPPYTYGPLAQLGSAHYPLLYHFCLFGHIPIPDPISPHVLCSNICFVSCPHPRCLLSNPKPKSHCILLHITSPCSIFVSILLCLNPCLFPSTLLCSFQYLYIDNFLYVPQSEINIDCPLWTPICLIRTFRTLQKPHPSKLRTREHWVAKHQSLSCVLVEPCH